MDLMPIFQISLGISIFGILFILSRNLPLIPDYQVKYVPREKRIISRFKRNISEGRIKTTHKTQKFKEKVGGRLRIRILKLDNFLISRLKKTRERRMHLENIYFPKIEKIKKKKKHKEEKENTKKEG